MTEIVSGLSEGERVVVSSQFLIDSESQLQEALRKIVASSKGEAQAPQEAPAPEVYTCPMHPEVTQDHPGRCPKCGMFLEKEEAEAGAQP